MLKRFFTILAITAVAAMAIVGCKKDKDNTTDNLAEKIIGKWIIADLNGKPAPTNEKKVTTFISTTKAIESSSKVDYSATANKWNVYLE